MIRAALAPLLPSIGDEFGLTYGRAGGLATAYFLTYAALQFASHTPPPGWAWDKVSLLQGWTWGSGSERPRRWPP